MIKFSDFLKEKEKEKIVSVDNNANPDMDADVDADADVDVDVDAKNKKIDFDEFQTELIDILSKKYPDSETDDIEDMVVSFSKKVYKKFEPKDDVKESFKSNKPLWNGKD